MRRSRSLTLNARLLDDDEDEDEDDGDDDVINPPPPCSLTVSIPLSNYYDRTVKRASNDPFVPYENSSGIINLAECDSSDGGGMGLGEDAPDMSPEELVAATLGELRDLFGTGGVVAEAALTFSAAAALSARRAPEETAGTAGTVASGDGDEERGDIPGDGGGDLLPAGQSKGSGSSSSSGFVWMSLAQFMDTPDWEGEADLWESMLETYNLLLAPGALRGAAEPGRGRASLLIVVHPL